MLPRPGESSGRLHPRHRHHCTASTYSDKSHSFIWTHVKKTLISPPILAPFNPSLPAMHQTDASHLYGIRYALLQGYDQRQICLVQCLLLPDGSCARIHWSGLLVVTWATSKCRQYLFCLPHFTSLTDHLLIPIFNSYTLQKSKDKIFPPMFYSCQHPRKQVCIPDTLSRALTSCFMPEEECDEATAYVRHIVTCSAITMDEWWHPIETKRTLQELPATARVDPVYARLLTFVSLGFPSSQYDPYCSILLYWKLWDSLYTDWELVLYNSSGHKLLLVMIYFSVINYNF